MPGQARTTKKNAASMAAFFNPDQASLRP